VFVGDSHKPINTDRGVVFCYQWNTQGLSRPQSKQQK